MLKVKCNTVGPAIELAVFFRNDRVVEEDQREGFLDDDTFCSIGQGRVEPKANSIENDAKSINELRIEMG